MQERVLYAMGRNASGWSAGEAMQGVLRSVYVPSIPEALHDHIAEPTRFEYN
jgi:hypothetical protein